MTDYESKLLKIFAARFLCICQENDFDMVCKIWRHYISTMDMKFTCITRDKTRVFVRDPMMKYSRAGDKQKPIMYISVDKDVALKILALGYLP